MIGGQLSRAPTKVGVRWQKCGAVAADTNAAYAANFFAPGILGTGSGILRRQELADGGTKNPTAVDHSGSLRYKMSTCGSQ